MNPKTSSGPTPISASSQYRPQTPSSNANTISNARAKLGAAGFFYFRRSHCWMMSRHRFNKMSKTTGTTSTKMTKTARDDVSVFKPRISRRPPVAATEVTTRISMMDFSPKRGCQGGGADGGPGLSTFFGSRFAAEGVGSFSGLVSRHLSSLAGMGISPVSRVVDQHPVIAVIGNSSIIPVPSSMHLFRRGGRSLMTRPPIQ